MYNPQDVSIAIKKYLAKLKKVIENEVVFNLGNTKVVNKARVDDILCCIEGSFPKEYKDYLAKHGFMKLKSYLFLNQLHAAIKNKFLFSTTNYAVNVSQAESNINALASVLDSDLNKVLQES